MATKSPKFLFTQGTNRYRAYKFAGFALLTLLILIVAFAYNDTGSITLFDNDYKFSITRVTKSISFMVAILGLQVVAGFTGQLSLGQGFFFGTGAYVSAYLVADQDWAWFTSLLVVIPVCFLIGLLFGIPALRIKGLYLALVTLGMAAVFPSLIKLDFLLDYTGGAAGKQVDSDFIPPSWLPLDGIVDALHTIPLIGQYFGEGEGLSSKEEQRVWTFFLMTILALICFKVVSNLIKSRPGRAMRAIRDNETSAAVNGMSLAFHKTMSFGVASALGGVGGMIYVAELGIASEGDFTQLISILFVVGMVVGGVGTLSGAVLGGLVIAFIPDWASSTQNLPGVPERWLQGPTGGLILGVGLIVVTFVLPGGIIAGVRKIRGRIVQVLPETPALMPGVAGAAPLEPVSAQVSGGLDGGPTTADDD
ncbi:MAG: branched-chain amino acid ABC transporter permease [Ilumatobacter sp.]|jgi:branched-chain amino acid transport system permease protein|uniref:branched-chain amino acid ABC transporter permease n=1 Tax=Ilumatobacter sp. TaxID=1967498 RepID=UPI001D8E9F4E|nr:branched-chain amino acid ABC transporter permease [Ilumatobacter sp.]MBT5277156.1 branched-chain amino acid ABC transporter permease [Ilumatobacter sp.]MBT5554556.1 branched-chain amino acid ABC transporter permease [Ilumatobacter sp.]MBT5867044.1 branched-chain amino acid ABC transporter permease [Ilumatobacter sp.]MBT7430821.1 branched-chain amino acid ABC transporter permease [Ilumatobacter sp.]